MSTDSKPTPSAAPTAQAITDHFIKARLPGWLNLASAKQLDALRDCFKAHSASSKQVVQATHDLRSPQAFAEQAFKPLLDALGSPGHDNKALEWLEIRQRIKPGPIDVLERVPKRYNAMLRLMQGFPGGVTFFDGTGVVQPGSDAVLSGDADAFAARCHALDVGKQYQDALARIFTPATVTLLAEHQHTAFALASQRALMQGELSEREHTALQYLDPRAERPAKMALNASAGQLHMLDCTLTDGMVMRLHETALDVDVDAADAGVILYLPFDRQRPVRRFETFERMTQFLSAKLADTHYRRQLLDLVHLKDRPNFITTLNNRLADEVPDLGLDGAVPSETVFRLLAQSQVARIEEEGRLMLVPAADADREAAERRMALWKDVGLGVLGVAGLAVPAIGMVLFAKMAVDTLGEVYAGVKDWHEGHQHEAMEHMCEVAKTIAVTAGTVVGATLVARAFTGSAFVDALEPVTLGDASQRLWNNDLQAYEVTPDEPVLQDDGLYSAGAQRYLRIDTRYYQVKQAAPGKPWCLSHPDDEQAYAPQLEHNGERCWRLRQERPLEWDDSRAMLDRLWPQQPPLQAQRAEQILRVAGVDQDELRGILVENRPAPANLRDTLRRFEADAKIATLFERLRAPEATLDDPTILTWCRDKAATPTMDAAAAGVWLEARQGELQGSLLDHLAQPAAATGDLFGLVKRDFPGLPDAYAEDAVKGADPELETVAKLEAKVPYSIATRARSLLALARLNRAIEGLFLESSYADSTGELVLALLGRLPHWPRTLNLELRQSRYGSQRIAIMDPQGAPDSQVVLVHQDGVFRLYDSQGLERDEEVAEPGDIFQAVVALLDEPTRRAMALDPDDPARALRQALIKILPNQRSDVLSRLGWRASKPWFNPGKRLADGRVGYPLGGRASRNARRDAENTLRQRVRALYPIFDDTQVADKVRQLMNDSQGRAPFQALLHEENELALLEHAVSAWVQATPDGVLRRLRREFSRRFCAAWRYHCDEIFNEAGQITGRSLDVSNCRIEQLPTLPEGTDFGHITRLVMCRVGLRTVPTGFFTSFDNLRGLNMSGNELSALPAGLSELVDLSELRLARNRIEMDEADQACLAQLSQLTVLDLSRNPIAVMSLHFDQASQLRRLYLGSCRLRSIPAQLHLCSQLSLADLSGNQIANVPPELAAMPVEFRYRLFLANNPLPIQVRRSLYRVGDQPNHAVAVDELAPTAMARWLERVPEGEQADRRALWARVSAAPESGELFRLLGRLTGSSDFTSAGDYLSTQMWSLLQSLDEDAGLREQIFADANEIGGCVDHTADRFSRLLVQRLVHQANQQGAGGRAGDRLLHLARQLFRLDRLDRWALAEAQRREVLQREVEGRQIDVLEVVLGYRIALTGQLDLPCQPQTMHFVKLAGVTADGRREALSAVRADEASDMLLHNIAGREFWRNYVKTRHSAVFNDIRTRMQPEEDALNEEGQDINSQDYLKRWEALAARRQMEEDNLILYFTQDALDRTDAGERLEEGEFAQVD